MSTSTVEIPTIKVNGPHEEKEDTHIQQLLDQLSGIPNDAEALRVDHDTPSDTEWSLLSKHFTSLKNLELEAGHNEELNDKSMPTHWPLERLQISSSCASLVENPYILDGRVKHLILLLTSGLRFEGPTSKELQDEHKAAIERGEEKADFITVHEGTPEERKIEITYLPGMVSKWMFNKYANGDGSQKSQVTASREPPEEVHIETLEIIENDATDTFNRMTLALPHVAMNVTTLNVRSTSGLDFHFTPADFFGQFLPQIPALKTLVLSLGDIYPDPNHLPGFYELFPPTLSTLRFRGPVCLAMDPRWNEWVDSFADPEYLPDLKTLSFVLDLDYPARKEGEDEGPRKPVEVTAERLHEAKVGCERLYAAARKRGVTVEPFVDRWAEGRSWLKQVDERWEKM
ncbi:hypothetical protein FQN49_008270 [Arthroderma sp. PD_2]|nr:hypothetical protein FQN49_008270 [Arthroderma sp. PD_2]